MRPQIGIFACAVVLVAASSSCATAPRAPADHDVQGDWEEDFGVAVHPGSSTFVSLTESGGRVEGTGTYTREAGAPGTFVVSGTIARDSILATIVFALDVPQATPDTEQFVGALTTRDRIDGTLTSPNRTSPFNLVRRTTGDPP